MTATEPQMIEEMFVQVARNSKSSDGVLTLTGVSRRRRSISRTARSESSAT
jgi:hypothetical protein